MLGVLITGWVIINLIRMVTENKYGHHPEDERQQCYFPEPIITPMFQQAPPTYSGSSSTSQFQRDA